MDMMSLIIFAAAIGIIYVIALLGLMAWMAHKASQTAPKAISHIPAQEHILVTVQEFASAYRYQAMPSQDHIHVFRKGRGWLTSLTELHLHLHDDGSASLEAIEAVNFLFKLIYFPINASTFLGKPVRQHKVKNINLLLERLQATPIVFSKHKTDASQPQTEKHLQASPLFDNKPKKKPKIRFKK